MNPSLPYYSRYNYRWNPRKWRPIRYNHVYNPTMLYGAEELVKKGHVESSWIGRKFIPYYVHYCRCSENCDYVCEEVIAKFAGMYRYRIIFGKVVDNEFIMRSKPTIENRPLQMNILIDQNGRIYDVMYF